MDVDYNYSDFNLSWWIFQVIGVVYFNKRATEMLLSFHTVSPLNRCTYVGIDSGAQPIQVNNSPSV